MKINKFEKKQINLNNNYYINKKDNCNKFNLDSLYEIEHFLCTLRNTCKCIDLYKFLK